MEYYDDYYQPTRGNANAPSEAPLYENKNHMQNNPSLMHPPSDLLSQMSLNHQGAYQSHYKHPSRIQKSQFPAPPSHPSYNPSSLPQNMEPPLNHQPYPQSTSGSWQQYDPAPSTDVQSQYYPTGGLPIDPQQPWNSSSLSPQQNPLTPPLPPMPQLANQSNYPPRAIPHLGQHPPQYTTSPHMPPMDRTGRYPSAQTAFSDAPGAPIMPGPSQSVRNFNLKLPDAVKVIENDRSLHTGCFFTHETLECVPPLASTDFIFRDDGNCNPRFVRSSLYAVPTTSDLVKSLNLPITLTISPFANLHPEDQPIVISDLGPQGPVRCIRCKAYMSPFVEFTHGGQRFRCPLCNVTNQVPSQYFAHLDQSGRRVDTLNRPELYRGSYELLATAEYCKDGKLPQAPAFIFILDVSQASVRSGLVSLFCSKFVERILPSLPREEYEVEGNPPAIKLGFITYDHQLHFYTFGREPYGSQDDTGQHNGQPATHNSSSQPYMHVVADVEDVFVPAVDGFLISPDPTAIANLLHLIPQQCCANSSQSCGTADAVLGSAIQAGVEALLAANRPGKLFVLHANLPTAEAPGKLKARNDGRLIGTEKEKDLLLPAGGFYTTLGAECVKVGCSVNLFLFPSSYVDVSTLAEVPRLTAGHIYKYNYFQADLQGNQFLSELAFAFSQSKAFDALMRVRTSTGIRPVEFYGNCNIPYTSDIELAAVDSKTTVTVEIRHDDKLQEKDLVYVQVACLFTSVSGQRRIRVHNLSLVVKSSKSAIFRLVDLDAHMNFLGKFALRSLYSYTHSHVVDDLTDKISHTLAAYRRYCSESPGNLGVSSLELVFPTNMALFALYILCLMKTEAFAPADNSSIDDRSLAIFRFNSMDVKESAAFLYPRMYSVRELRSNFEGEVVYPPPAIRCAYANLSPEGAYIVENGMQLFLWLGADLSDGWVQSVLGVPSLKHLEPERFYELPRLDNDTSKGLCFLVDRIHEDHGCSMRLLVIRQGDKMEARFKRFMVEDGHGNNWVSYSEYLCHIHKEVNARLR